MPTSASDGEVSGILECDNAPLAWRRVPGQGPTVVWLGGFASDMSGTKAQAIADWARAEGRDFLRFDYFGHGVSGGDFRQGSITRWRSDALAVIDQLTQGPLVLAGSSMGGWIACLAALSRAERIAGMVLVAPACDFTEKLMKPRLPSQVLRAIARDGEWVWASAYGEGNPITRLLLEDGDRWSILDAMIPIKCPVRILHGSDDPDVPWRHGLDLALGLEAEDVTFTLVKGGDHRLSRDQDLVRLIASLDEVWKMASSPSR
jgi:pimeloyl-ACP methyl ester carboxylesterase